jgi:hypothetical protein
MGIRGSTYYPPDEDRTDAAIASAARTASGTGSAFTVGPAETLKALLAITAHAGTTPTLDVRLETRITGDATWYTAGSFPQQNTDVTVGRAFGALGDECRWAWTIGGTTPSFTFSISATANN